MAVDNRRAGKVAGAVGVAGLLALAAATVAVRPKTTPAPAPAPIYAPTTGEAREKPGRERWMVKTGGDQGAAGIDVQHPVSATVEALVKLAPPSSRPETARVSPVETTCYTVAGTITGAKEETDGDFHLVLAGSSGQTMIVEVPRPDFLSASCPWKDRISEARSQCAARLQPRSGKLRAEQQAVIVTGPGFFDFSHHQDGVAPNAIELHPVLAVSWQ